MSEKKLLATRAGYGQGLLDIGALYDDVVVLEGDLGAATGTAAFGKAYPDRYVEAGIAEQNEVGMASGLAATGWVPFVTSFAIFTAGRACEIVRNAVAYNKMNVKLVGSHCGITPALDGGSHMCIEDIAWMKAIPGMVVLNPCDYNQTRLMVKKMYEYDEECLKVFLEKQLQLFDEPVAETMEEAEAFLEDCMAVVVDSLREVREYFEENGTDISDMSNEELEEASEVFSLPSGRYLVVEG